ncbi:hypothetical protein [Actinomadura roseirufa]|uniref:hypothetical protein n=1 Tax=Actinomadura roseirufa TaxID=2094049 RepID=UPI0010418B71|nr:hypothetical protein [Actinomadura roseirufa]
MSEGLTQLATHLQARVLSAALQSEGDQRPDLIVTNPIPSALRGGKDMNSRDRSIKARREVLELQFPGVRPWYGKATSQWWALMPWHGLKAAFLVGGVDSIENLGPLILRELDRRRGRSGSLAGSSAAAVALLGTARGGGTVPAARGGTERHPHSAGTPPHPPRGHRRGTR